MPKQFLAVIPVLMTRNVGRALVFYEALGFSTDFQDHPTEPTYAGIARDGVCIHLQWQDPQHWANKLDRPMTRFTVRDLDSLFTEFAAAIPDLRAPFDTAWGTRELHFYDLDGNGLQFCAA